MRKSEFLGVRLEKDVIGMIERTAKEERVDKTRALKELVIRGWRHYILQKYLEFYRTGKCSIDRAAEAVGITVAEMMQEAARVGIKSGQTNEEYAEGLKLLIQNK